MIDGVSSRAFSATTLAPYPRPAVGFRGEIIKHSQETYGTPKADVEQQIAEWAGVSEIMPPPVIRPAPARSSPARPSPAVSSSEPVSDRGAKLYEAVCWEGGEKVMVPFKPDGVRPIYCKNHLYKLSELRQRAESQLPKPISLQDALRQGTHGFTGHSKNRKSKKKGNPADLEGLRSLLSDITPTN